MTALRWIGLELTIAVYFTVITRVYDALSKHALSCSGIKWENLAALKTLKAPSVFLPEQTHWLCTIYKYKRRKAKQSSLDSKKPRFRFSTVLTKNRGFRFRYGFRHSTNLWSFLTSVDFYNEVLHSAGSWYEEAFWKYWRRSAYYMLNKGEFQESHTKN